MAKTLNGTTTWLKKHWDVIKKDNHCWTNTSKIFDEKEIDKIKKYVNDRPEITLSVLIIGIKQLRCQWVAVSIPEYFRSNNAAHELHYEENSFWFISCNYQYHELFKERVLLIKENLESIKKEVPECKIIILKEPNA